MTTLENAAAVLRLFQRKGVTQGHVGLTFSEVVNALTLPKSTVSRLFATMESQGLLERDAETRCYHIGRVLLAAAGHYLSAPLVDSVSAAMVRLAESTGCMGYVSKAGRTRNISNAYVSWSPFHPDGDAAGQPYACGRDVNRPCALAQLSDAEVQARYLDNWQVVSANSPQTPDALCARLAEIRQHGWSLARNETLPGISSLSVIAHNKHHGETVALCLSFLSQETEPGYPPDLLEALRATAASRDGQKIWRTSQRFYRRNISPHRGKTKAFGPFSFNLIATLFTATRLSARASSRLLVS